MSGKVVYPKTYLGDGVYAEYDGFHLILTTESDVHRIYLAPDVLTTLKTVVKGWADTAEANADPGHDLDVKTEGR